MEIKYIEKNRMVFALLENGIICSVGDALDFIGTASYNGADSVIIPMERLSPDFFTLKTRLAGDILQKFVNYNMRAAIVGDFSVFSSKSLADFIRESNRGRHIYFKDSTEEAISVLSSPIL